MNDHQQDSNTSVLFNDLPLWSAPFGLKLLDQIKFKSNMQILDIGCGLGFPAIEIAMRFGNNAMVYGIDPWKEGLLCAKEKAHLLTLTNTTFLKQYAENMSFDDDFFDLIVSNNGINNVQNIDMALMECARVAKSGAQFVFTMYTNEVMKEFYPVFEEVLRLMNLQEAAERLKAHINSNQKSIETLQNKLINSGFELNVCKDEIFFLRYLNGTALLNNPWIKEVFYPGWYELVDESQRDLVFENLETALNELARNTGELKLSVPFVLIDSVKR